MDVEPGSGITLDSISGDTTNLYFTERRWDIDTIAQNGELLDITDVIKDLSVVNLFMNSRNRLWVATTENIGIYDENISQWLVFKNYTLPYGKTTCIVEDAEGVMWLGTEHGIFEANVPLEIPNKINLTGGFEKEVGLTPNKVLSMHVTNTNQILVL